MAKDPAHSAVDDQKEYSVATEDLDISNVRNLTAALERTPNGVDAVALATKMGIWTAEAHNNVIARPAYPRNVAELDADSLSNLLSNWTSEFGRIAELLGALNGQLAQLKIRAKGSRAAARSRIRKSYLGDIDAGKNVKLPTSTALNDEAEEDPAVIDIDERLALVELLLAHTSAAKESTGQYLASISREIAYRDAQMKARIYG